MADLNDGETVEVKGSGARPYVLRNVGGVYSCSCPAWRNQSVAIERRTCKHLRRLRGDEAESARVGGEVAPGPDPAADAGASDKVVPPLLLAERWDNAQDLTGWWLSEKLDGVRAYWDGTALISRLGNPFHAPDWFLAGLPEVPLDGELWIGRKAFQRTVGIVRRQDRSDLWKEVAFVAFDAPAIDAPFEGAWPSSAPTSSGTGRPTPGRTSTRCVGAGPPAAELARVEGLGGEGLMVRRPGSRYEVGRSTTLLKIKSFRDAEARVLEHLKGAGRHKGRLGALLVELADGTRFSVGTGFSDAQRESPPPIGSLITFRYQELSDSGVPRFPSFVGPRHDVAWPPAGADAAPPPIAPDAPPRSPAAERGGRDGWGCGARDGPAPRAGRGRRAEVLGGVRLRPRGDGPVWPDRRRGPGQDEGAGRRGRGPPLRRGPGRGEDPQGLLAGVGWAGPVADGNSTASRSYPPSTRRGPPAPAIPSGGRWGSMPAPSRSPDREVARGRPRKPRRRCRGGRL
jgi:DNA ligase-1